MSGRRFAGRVTEGNKSVIIRNKTPNISGIMRNKTPFAEGIYLRFNSKLGRKDLSRLPFSLSPREQKLLKFLFDRPILSRKLPDIFWQRKEIGKVRALINKKFEAAFDESAIIKTNVKGDRTIPWHKISPTGVLKLNPDLFGNTNAFEIGKDFPWEDLFSEKQALLIKSLLKGRFPTYVSLERGAGVAHPCECAKEINRLCKEYGLPAAIEYKNYPMLGEEFIHRVGLKRETQLLSLENFFTKHMIRLIGYVAENPFTSAVGVYKDLHIPNSSVWKGFSYINNRCKKYNLPIAVEMKGRRRRLYRISRQFAENFQLSVPKKLSFKVLFSYPEIGIINFLLSKPHTSPKEIGESLGISAIGYYIRKVNKRCKLIGLPKGIEVHRRGGIYCCCLTEELIEKFGLHVSKKAFLYQFFTPKQIQFIHLVERNPLVTQQKLRLELGIRSDTNHLVKRIRRTCRRYKLPRPFYYSYTDQGWTLEDAFAKHFSSDGQPPVKRPQMDIPKTDIPFANRKKLIETLMEAHVPGKRIETFFKSIYHTAAEDRESGKTEVEKIMFNPSKNCIIFHGMLKSYDSIHQWKGIIGKVSEKGFTECGIEKDESYRWNEFTGDPKRFVYVKRIVETRELPPDLRENEYPSRRRDKDKARKLSKEDWAILREIVRSTRMPA